MGVKVLTDSTSYIDEGIRKELDIRIVSLNVLFNDEILKETEIDNKTFYKNMQEKGIPTSSQPSISELHSEMRSVVEKGDDLLCIFLSSDMSGTYSTARMVKEMVLEEFSSARIEIMDSRSNCMQLGFAVITAAKAASKGEGLDSIVSLVKENIERSRFLFIPDNLEYLRKGGRIGSASALIGNILRIIPILTVEDGKTTILSKVRVKKNAVIVMLGKMMQDARDYGLVEAVVHHINCHEEAEELAKKIKELVGIDTRISDIGPVIGLHVGPGAIGIAYYTERNMKRCQ